MSAKLKFWIAGILVAALGLVLARVVSGMFSAQTGVQLAVYYSGAMIALVGLVIILAGIRKGG